MKKVFIACALTLWLGGCTPWQECFNINGAYRIHLVETAPKLVKLPKTLAAIQTKYRKEFDERNCTQFGMVRY